MPRSVWGQDVQAVLTNTKTQRTREVQVGAETRTIPVPFPSPEDWRDKWIYFLLVDRFNNPQVPPRRPPFDAQVGDFQGGTIEGIRDRLGYLEELGAGAIWLTPVLKNAQYIADTFHGYGIQDFLEVDPRFASSNDPESELQRLIDDAHARGIYVIFDIVLNHAGDLFAYVLDNGDSASEATFRDRIYPIRWRDQAGTPREDWPEPPGDAPRDGVVWPIELQQNRFFRRQGRGGEGGGDFSSLKELVTAEQQVRNTLIRAYQYIIGRFDIDGYRIDTLKYIEPDFARTFGNSMREYALSIGKKNFFTFGEVFDDEERIAGFVGRRATDEGDIVGVDAALDFPLFFNLPSVAKALSAPAAVAEVYRRRKEVQRNVISSHGDASRFFVTFLNNHDGLGNWKERFYHRPPGNPDRFNDQVTLGVACLFALQGIPCLYYGTEQGLSGAGESDRAIREALWGKPGGFDSNHPFFQEIREIAALRNRRPVLRYGRQYFRPVSGNGQDYGISPFPGGVIAFSRILNDEEAVLVANTNTSDSQSFFVIVDGTLHADNPQFQILYSNNKDGPVRPDPVHDRRDVFIREAEGGIGRGPVRVMRVTLRPMEVQILGL